MAPATSMSKKTGRGFWARLQPRERNLIAGLVVVAVGMSLAVLFVLRSSRFGELEQQITDQKRALDLVYTRGSSYKDKLAQKGERERSISDKPLMWSTLIEQASSATGVSVSDQGEQPVFAPSEGIRKRTYTFYLRDVTLEQLISFITHVETKSESIVVTQRLHIRSASANEDRLNRVDVELATWERVAAETETVEGG